MNIVIFRSQEVSDSIAFAPWGMKPGLRIKQHSESSHILIFLTAALPQVNNNSMHTRCPQDAGNAFCFGTHSWKNWKFGNKSETNGYGVPVFHELLPSVLGVKDAQRTPAPSVGEVVLLYAGICCPSLRWVTFLLRESYPRFPLQGT